MTGLKPEDKIEIIKKSFKEYGKNNHFQYRKEFIKRYESEWEDSDKAYIALNNFLCQTSVRSGYMPPYEFFKRLEQFYQELTNENLY